MKHSNAASAVKTSGLGKRYGSFWALQDCNIDIPAGSITALVGSNGAGKSTLLQLLSGLSTATRGKSNVLDTVPSQTPKFLASIGYLAQEIPLYPQLTAEDYIGMGAHLNTEWNEALIRERLNYLGIPFDKPVGKLSGGQQAQVALAVALAKKPRLLLLDEPVAALDPLARRDFLSSLSQAVVDSDVTVVMSSHLLADLELVCDHVVILAEGHVQLCDEIEHTLATHKFLTGPRAETGKLRSEYTIISETHTPRQTTLLVKTRDKSFTGDAGWQTQDATIEDIVLAYMSQAKQHNQSDKTGDA